MKLTGNHNLNPDVHFRLYRSSLTGAPVVICLQDFDYPDYDASRFLTDDAWTTQEEADAALAKLPARLYRIEWTSTENHSADLTAEAIAALMNIDVAEVAEVDLDEIPDLGTGLADGLAEIEGDATYVAGRSRDDVTVYLTVTDETRRDGETWDEWTDRMRAANTVTPRKES